MHSATSQEIPPLILDDLPPVMTQVDAAKVLTAHLKTLIRPRDLADTFYREPPLAARCLLLGNHRAVPRELLPDLCEALTARRRGTSSRQAPSRNCGAEEGPAAPQ